MPDPHDDLETRVTHLEEDVTRLQEQTSKASGDAAAARVLAGGADRDVSDVRVELRAHTRALNALRETQLEQDDRITTLEVTVRDGFAEMRNGFATVHTGMAQISALLKSIAGPGPE